MCWVILFLKEQTKTKANQLIETTCKNSLTSSFSTKKEVLVLFFFPFEQIIYLIMLQMSIYCNCFWRKITEDTNQQDNLHKCECVRMCVYSMCVSELTYGMMDGILPGTI